ncbi:MAG: site-2 protease family protein [Chloroflexi bacterium]|nr:site-2 protease family protein [Chloroflexota bacterium]MBK6710379.1 site-2 protease family protein [Chloroflexota bacterium]MBK7180088.1 site-2 protease family protein [Chloroflexota bacterium]MBK7917698.1 site-2 protease family protein [Chloroflexota bacterium]MBK8934759.1 site-2 protease family protein [Chloroflexota bacterium]
MLGLNPATLISRMIVLLVAFTIHELAHAVTADRMGDPTPRRMGRITLNPLAHLDPFGTIMLLISGFGWAKPVMVNPMNLRGNPRTSMAIVAAAGPISNVIMAVIFALPFQLGLVGFSTFGGSAVFPSLGELLFQFVWINLILAFFNLIPIPPLDGYKILTGILPPDIAYRLRPLEQYGFLILMGAIFILPMLGIDVISNLIMGPSMAVLTFLIGL